MARCEGLFFLNHEILFIVGGRGSVVGQRFNFRW